MWLGLVQSGGFAGAVFHRLHVVRLLSRRSLPRFVQSPRWAENKPDDRLFRESMQAPVAAFVRAAVCKLFPYGGLFVHPCCTHGCGSRPATAATSSRFWVMTSAAESAFRSVTSRSARSSATGAAPPRRRRKRVPRSRVRSHAVVALVRPLPRRKLRTRVAQVGMEDDEGDQQLLAVPTKQLQPAVRSLTCHASTVRRGTRLTRSQELTAAERSRRRQDAYSWPWRRRLSTTPPVCSGRAVLSVERYSECARVLGRHR